MKEDTSALKILEKAPVRASAPCRVDAGGTMDIKAMALPFETEAPTTVNVALDLRTSVTVGPYRAGWVKLTSRGFEEAVEARPGSASLRPPFGAYFAAVAHFGFSGLEIHIESASPVKSALGGSSAALVALIRALAEIKRLSGEGTGLDRRRILLLAYHLEDALQGGYGGMQDQAAAVYGGVSQWRWLYGRAGRPYDREALLAVDGCRMLARRMLVAYCGLSHVSVATNRKWVEDFLEGGTRSAWLEANRTVADLAACLKRREWEKAAAALRREMELRRHATPEALIPETEVLVDDAEACHCGARFAGAGAGGSLWALGSEEAITRLRARWQARLSGMTGGMLLPCGVDVRGVRLESSGK